MELGWKRYHRTWKETGREEAKRRWRETERLFEMLNRLLIVSKSCFLASCINFPRFYRDYIHGLSATAV